MRFLRFIAVSLCFAIGFVQNIHGDELRRFPAERYAVCDMDSLRRARMSLPVSSSEAKYVDEIPLFDGRGIERLVDVVARNLQYPADVGRMREHALVIISVGVDAEGGFTVGRTIQSPNSKLALAVYDVFRRVPFPRWIPAVADSARVGVKLELPILFDTGQRRALTVAECLALDTPNAKYAVGRAQYSWQPKPTAKADVLPQFEGGGIERFIAWLKRNCPGEKRRCSFKFDIGVDGRVGKFKVFCGKTDVTESFAPLLDIMPLWSSAWNEGRKVPFVCRFVVDFSLEGTPETELIEPSTFSAKLVRAGFKGSKGDINVFRKWIADRITYPSELLANGASGRSLVNFAVDENGNVCDISIILSLHPRLTSQIVKTLEKSPQWQPGIWDGQPAKVKYTLPVDFVLTF